VKRQPGEWEKIFPTFLSDERLMFRPYKELKKLNRRTSNSVFKMGKCSE
jgi:hypothetical protein